MLTQEWLKFWKGQSQYCVFLRLRRNLSRVYDFQKREKRSTVDEFHFWLWISRLEPVRCSLDWNRIEIDVREKFISFRKNLSQIQRERERERDFFFWFDRFLKYWRIFSIKKLITTEAKENLKNFNLELFFQENDKDNYYI